MTQKQALSSSELGTLWMTYQAKNNDTENA